MDTDAPNKPTPAAKKPRSSVNRQPPAERVQERSQIRAEQEPPMNIEVVLMAAKQQIAESINGIAQRYEIPGVLLIYILQEIIYESKLASYRESFNALNQDMA